ncbi:MAG: prepilin-type cleavage/methylation domain-containing protein [Flavobacteriaceae bacterium]|nr:MAG: prepilin-type cleavage/methylation domain-containing protein [Flavobacteriaceae bacterium]
MQQHRVKGFTLIELMIVVAIIGILAAIAIPQFASYRIKAFNSAALSDLRNIMASEEAAYATNQSYAASTSGIGSGIITGLINTKASHNVTYNIQSLNSGVAYAVFTAHNRGDNIYAADSTGSMQFQHDVNAPASPLDVRTFAIAGLALSWGIPL